MWILALLYYLCATHIRNFTQLISKNDCITGPREKITSHDAIKTNKLTTRPQESYQNAIIPNVHCHKYQPEKWVSEWVVLCAARDIIGHIRDESFQAINCTGTDNSKQTSKIHQKHKDKQTGSRLIKDIAGHIPFVSHAAGLPAASYRAAIVLWLTLQCWLSGTLFAVPVLLTSQSNHTHMHSCQLTLVITAMLLLSKVQCLETVLFQQTGWLVTYQDGLPANRQSSIQVLIQQWECWESTLQPVDYKSDTLTITPPSYLGCESVRRLVSESRDAIFTRCWSSWESLLSWRIVSSLSARRSSCCFRWSVNWVRHADNSVVVSASCFCIWRHSSIYIHTHREGIHTDIVARG